MDLYRLSSKGDINSSAAGQPSGLIGREEETYPARRERSCADAAFWALRQPLRPRLPCCAGQSPFGWA